AHLRITGFDFAICARFSSGWSWTEAWLRDWRALSPAAKKRAGLCFNRAGKPWAISEINLSAQEAFREMLQEPADMTTYSWRRLLPTVGQLLRLSPQEQLALGDWASSNPEGNQMLFPADLAVARAEDSWQTGGNPCRIVGISWASRTTCPVLSLTVWCTFGRAIGQAAKLYGILNFFEQGVYGKVGAGSLWAIKERQYEATTQLTPDIRDNFRYIRAIVRARPQRQLPVVPLPCDRFVCASDAAEEPDTGGT
ncbi:unnamed protein product, partial [Symbiodinium necroappetens]